MTAVAYVRDFLWCLWRFIRRDPGNIAVIVFGMILRVGEGLITRFFPSLVVVVDLLSIFLIIIGTTGRLHSSLKDEIKDIMEETIRNYTMSVAVLQTPFGRALQHLVNYHVKQHKGGNLPIHTDMEIIIKVENLADTQQIPQAPPGYSWRWFRFIFDYKWRIKPIAWRREEILDPRDFIGEVIVMSYPTYLNIYNWIDPSKMVFFSIPTPVFAEEPLKTPLASVWYLRPTLRVSKWSESAGQMTDQVTLQIESLLTKPEQKERVIKEVFRNIESRSEKLQQACDGVYEIHRVKKLRILDQSIRWPHDGDKFWEFKAEYDLVVPAKLVKGKEILWDQLSIPIIFGRIAIVNRIIFQNRSDYLTLRRDRPPELLCHPYFADPTSVKVDFSERENQWTVEPDQGAPRFWFPGDTVYFLWHDTLINELIEKGHDST